jgi:hypothetical protein
MFTRLEIALEIVVDMRGCGGRRPGRHGVAGLS